MSLQSQPGNELSSNAPNPLPFQVNERQRLSEYIQGNLRPHGDAVISVNSSVSFADGT